MNLVFLPRESLFRLGEEENVLPPLTGGNHIFQFAPRDPNLYLPSLRGALVWMINYMVTVLKSLGGKLCTTHTLGTNSFVHMNH